MVFYNIWNPNNVKGRSGKSILRLKKISAELPESQSKKVKYYYFKNIFVH